MALLSASKGDKIGSIYYYVRSLALKYPFPAAASNLGKLFSKILEQDKLEMTENAINKSTFASYMLRFHASIHHVQHLKSAKKICNLSNKALTTLVAAESLDSWQLMQIVTIR